MRWEERDGAERNQPRTAQSFCVTREEIAASGYELSLNRYHEIAHEALKLDPPEIIIAELRVLEAEITVGLDKLVELIL